VKRCNANHHRVSHRTIRGLINRAEQIACSLPQTAPFQIHSEEKYTDDREASYGTSDDNDHMGF